MTDQKSLEMLAESYRADGFDVIVCPASEGLPVYLADTSIAILARKGDEVVALAAGEATSEEEQARFSARFDRESAVALLDEAELLLNPLTPRSAVVMAWSAFEAAARVALQPGMTAFAIAPLGKLIDLLAERQLIVTEERDLLQGLRILRNVVAHGGRSEEVPLVATTSVLTIARRLLHLAKVNPVVRLWSAANIAVVRKGLNPSDLKNLVEEANEVLSGLLRNWHEDVLAEWDLAEDARGRLVVVLKLSDITAAVMATFKPAEIENIKLLGDRLNRLWGDLLEIRSHHLLDRLMKAPQPQLASFA